MTPSTFDVAEHLLACFDAMYVALGESAPTFTCDAYVIRAHEMSRAFGGVALETRAYVGARTVTPSATVEGVLRHAVDADPSGALAMYAVAMVLGPRLLVSLLDARSVEGADDTFISLLDAGSEALVSEVLAIGRVVAGEPPIEDPNWQAVARSLGAGLDEAGNAESLGIYR